MKCYLRFIALAWGLLLLAASAPAQVAGTPGRDNLVIVTDGQTRAVIVVSPAAGASEKLAASELAKYIGQMSGATPQVANTREAIDAALKGTAPVLLVGQEALAAKPDWAARVRAAARPNPILGADAIGLLRDGNRVYIAGNNDQAHYYAAVELLWRWGCRWYLPTDFGECIPEYKSLSVGALDYAYGSPFEIRSYWISWNGDGSGQREFQRHNMMTARDRGFPPNGHALDGYTNDLPTAKNTFNFPITAPETAAHIAQKLDASFGRGESSSISIADGNYDSDYPNDVKLMKLQWDKYQMRYSVSDPMLELYNNVAKILQTKYPNSPAKLGFLVYANMTIPPVRQMTAERSLYGMIAPIDIDPIHGMDSPDSPPRQEYRDMLHSWAKILQGRLAIYDYDQGMLVWRDLPNPSHQAFRQDVKHYATAGILGISTESRNAIGTTFLNLFFRGRLMWNPDTDVDALLTEFYPKFYGPAAKPMEIYWSAIYKAWDDTIATEHEYFVAPAIYTPEVIETCRKSLAEADALVAPLAQKDNRTRNEQLVLDRMRFTHMSFDIMSGYMNMVWAESSNCNYAQAAESGKAALAVRENMTAMNGTFTTYKNIGEAGPAWFPGEVQQYADLAGYQNGTKGQMIIKLPLAWAFHRDKQRAGVQKGYASQPVDLAYWNANKDKYTLQTLKDYPDQWEMLRSDLYAQAQGVRDPDRQSFTGDMWYRTDVNLTADQVAGKVHLMFPGLFNECWLYINGKEVGYRQFPTLWWNSDYTFEWDVDLTGKLKAGINTIALRCNCVHHLGGMFRRPFLYEAK